MGTPAWGRVLPDPSTLEEPFWTGCREQKLMLQRCERCGKLLYPPTPLCRRCQGVTLAWEEVAPPYGKIATYTVNHQQWLPELDVPYVLAMAELDIDPHIRVTSVLIGVPTSLVQIGLPVQVEFVDAEGLRLPVLAPRPAETT